MWQFWLILAGAFLILEMITVGFLVFWLGIGALFAMLVSFFIDSVFIQTLVFVISSIILILLTKPFVRKFFGKQKTLATNAYSIIGKQGVVLKEIKSNTRQSWNCISWWKRMVCQIWRWYHYSRWLYCRNLTNWWCKNNS